MPISKKDSPAKIMHELKATRKTTKSPSRKSAAKHGTSHEQEVAIMLSKKGESNKKGKK
jgi:hypothetical protein